MNSCYHCTRRKPGCHSLCEDYKQDCEEYEQRRAYERRFAYVDNMPSTKKARQAVYDKKKAGGRQ